MFRSNSDMVRHYFNELLSDGKAHSGYDRVFAVLARTVKRQLDSKEYSDENKRWARTIRIPQGKENLEFLIKIDADYLNMFLNLAREMYVQQTQCKEGDQDYEEQVLILKPEHLNNAHENPEHQLFYAIGGSGCEPGNTKGKVIGEFLFDGEQATLSRADFLGVLKEECLPEWAEEKLKQLQPPDEQQDGPSM